METFITFLESNAINKFNILWQIVRTEVRSIKDVNAKIKYVMEFLNAHPNQHNYGRVMNWTKMIGVAYPENSEQRKAFKDFEQFLVDNKNKFISFEDTPNDLTKIPTDKLQLVLKDLKTRKYGFQYKQAPKSHDVFVKNIEQELKGR